MNKTSWPKQNEIKRKWYIVDATDIPLGRLATVVAVYLTGKNKPNYAPNVDMGDFVVVINADKVKLTGNKGIFKEYTHYTGYPSGLKRRKAKDLLKQNVKFVILHAVKGMLPKNSLRTNQLHRLRIFTGSTHDHEAQKPEEIKIKL